MTSAKKPPTGSKATSKPAPKPDSKQVPSKVRFTPPAISPSRKAAFQVLLSVELGTNHSDDLLRGRTVNALPNADRNLATALVLGTLRWQIRLDQQIQGFLKKPDAKLDPEVRIALRMGAFQLHHLTRIPARAAIDESVELAKQSGHKFASGLVNAVLRKLATTAAPFQHLEETAEELALEEGHPRWMVERWAANFGLEAARALCVHGQSQPTVTVRFADASLSSELEAELAEGGIGLEQGALLTAARRVVSGDVTAAAAFKDGRVRLQDEGSQLVAELAGVAGAGAGKILDTCAAPGGKTLILAERNPLARVVACESSSTRLEQLSKRLAFLGDRVECRLADSSLRSEETGFDLVLADVPCSGTGTLGRNPEIRHRLKVEDLARQAERQVAILTAAIKAVRAGGRVVYSTCSLEPEENEQVVAAALSACPEARVVSLNKSLQALEDAKFLAAGALERLQGALTAEGFLRLLPGAFETDGFFVAMIERTPG